MQKPLRNILNEGTPALQNRGALIIARWPTYNHIYDIQCTMANYQKAKCIEKCESYGIA